MEPVFHLSLSVSDIDKSRAFYCDRLGAQPGRTTEAWMDVWLFGAQLTLYRRPDAVTPSPFREAQHFGATLPWTEWVALKHELDKQGAEFAALPMLNEEKGAAKMLLSDPDGYLVEVKAYRDRSTLQQPEPAPLPI